MSRQGDPWASNPYGIGDYSWMEQPSWWPQRLDGFRAAVLQMGGPELAADPDEAWLQLLNWSSEEADRRRENDPHWQKIVAMVERLGQANAQLLTDTAVECLTEQHP